MPDMLDETTALLIIASAKREAQAAASGLGDMVKEAVTGLVEKQVKDAIGGGIIAERVEYIRGRDGRDVEFSLDGTRVGVRYVGDESDFVYTGDLTGPQGDDGQRGETGRGIASARLDDDGDLIIAMSDGTETSAGPVPTSVGEQGVGIARATITRAGRLVFTLTDGNKIDAGLVRPKDGKDGRDGKDGKDGEDGEDGEDGKDGRGLEFDINGDMIGIRREGDIQYSYTQSLRGRSFGGGGSKAPEVKNTVDLINDLTNPSTWVGADGSDLLYRGIVVSVINDGLNNGVFTLIDDDFTTLNNWAQLAQSTPIRSHIFEDQSIVVINDVTNIPMVEVYTYVTDVAAAADEQGLYGNYLYGGLLMSQLSEPSLMNNPFARYIYSPLTGQLTIAFPQPESGVAVLRYN